jgi:hypothetical protein
MTTTTPHTLSQLADIGAKAAHHTLNNSSLVCVASSFVPNFKQDAPAREAFTKAVLDAVGYKLPVDPEREAFDAWFQSAQIPQGETQAFSAWKAGREELRKAQMPAKEPPQPKNGDWIDWPGDERPVDKFAKVEVRYRGINKGDILPAGDFRWNHINHPSDIIAYKIVSP